jgi:phosphopantothenoylcysteine decarboxylase/phosphopantothenate--cysteine ligase
MSDVLKITKATDILKSIIEKKYTQLKIVGFAAETDLSDEILMKKYSSKPVDLLIGTKVNNGIQNGNESIGFNALEANYRIMEKGKMTFEGLLSKEKLANEILKRINL